MKISIFGLGYVGCVSLACLSKNGHTVIGVDVVKNKVNLINNGQATIIEKDIDTLIEKQHKLGMISATTNSDEAILATDVSIICVGTPSDSSGNLNLDYVFKVAADIAESIKQKQTFHVVAIRSTVSLGTNNNIIKIIEKKSGKKVNIDFGVVSNPEFLREGTAISDYFNPPVTVIGTDSDKSYDIMLEVYKDIDSPIKRVKIEEAEIIKYVNNSFHALKITFANEIGNVCKKLNIDSHSVMDLFIMDKQLNLSSYYLRPGFAYGGSCLPKDLKGLVTLANNNNLDTPLLSSINKSNEFQKKMVFDIIKKYNKKNIGIIGLSFKKGTDDLRFSPMVDVAKLLYEDGYNLSIYDENVFYTKLRGINKDYIDQHIPNISKYITNNFDDMSAESDLLIINHKCDMITDSFLDKNKNKFIVDLVNMKLKKKRKNYHGISW
jgi:GDP-mannose 6-dehydrogenase